MSALSAASLSSTAWRPCSARSRIAASGRSASMTATHARCWPGFRNRSIGRVFLLFPDPWPKKRQLKRRLLCEDTLAEIARVLRPGGEFRFASDNGDYAAQTLRLAQQSDVFTWPAERATDWRERPADWPETRYERKALARDASRLSQFQPALILESEMDLRAFFVALPMLLVSGGTRRNRHRCRLLCGLRGATHSNPEYKACLARAADKADAALNQAYKMMQDKIRAAAKDMGKSRTSNSATSRTRKSSGSPIATAIARSRTVSPSAARQSAAIIRPVSARSPISASTISSASGKRCWAWSKTAESPNSAPRTPLETRGKSSYISPRTHDWF